MWKCSGERKDIGGKILLRSTKEVPKILPRDNDTVSGKLISCDKG